jgi:hypothetical protein
VKFPGSRFELDDAQIAEWQSIYPQLAVAREVRKAWAWLDANPARRKKNVKRFLVNWLNRADDAHKVPVSPPVRSDAGCDCEPSCGSKAAHRIKRQLEALAAATEEP